LSAADGSGRGLPRAVWALGVTSLLMDTSSELIHGLLPVFLVVTLGASATALGVIEGIAEATAQISRVFSGWLSDVLGRRKALTVLGYGLAAAMTPREAPPSACVSRSTRSAPRSGQLWRSA
jgi:MFS family permease